jgi:hypothetical protein
MIAVMLVVIAAGAFIICCFALCNLRKKRRMYTDTEKRYILHDAVFYEILFAFGVSPHDQTDYCAWEHINFSRMGHARALYDFFETSKSKRDRREHDDVVSEDFGFHARRIKRPTEDRTRLNKDLFHLSYKRLRHLKTPQNKPWPDTILGCLHEPCVEFIKHLLNHRSEFGEPDDFTMWEQLLGKLTTGREFRISRSFVQVGTQVTVEAAYSFHSGQVLQSGRGELTKPHPKANAKVSG